MKKVLNKKCKYQFPIIWILVVFTLLGFNFYLFESLKFELQTNNKNFYSLLEIEKESRSVKLENKGLIEYNTFLFEQTEFLSAELADEIKKNKKPWRANN